MAHSESTLADEVAFLFREQTEVESVTQREYGGATLSVAVVTYADVRENSNDSTRYRQTVLFLEDDQLDLPEFSLSPKPKGLLSVAMKLIGDFGNIQFEDSPKFSESYVLQGWVVEATRVFFNRSIREHFADRPGWSVRGKQHSIAVYRKNHVCDDDEIEEFAAEALEMLTLFQLGEEALDEQPELAREAGPQEILEATKSMNGVFGSMIARRLEAQPRQDQADA